MTPPTRTDTTGFAHGLGAWALSAAVCAGLASYAAHVLGEVSLGVELYQDITPPDVGGSALVTAGFGLAYGLLVGGAAGLLLAARGSTLTDRAEAAFAWALGAATAGAAGGAAAPYVVVVTAGALPAEVSSSLAWAAVGLVTGLVARLASWWANESPEPEEDDGEQPAQPPGEGQVWVPTTQHPRSSVRRERVQSLLRLLPLFAASVLSFVAAAVAPSHAAPGLLAAGLVGLCAAGTLWGQEGHLRELDRRTRHLRP